MKIAHRPVSHPGADALRSLAAALLPHLRELLAVDPQHGELVDVIATVPAPRRTLLADCRSGVLAASKVGRRWLATREAVDAYLQARRPRVAPAGDDEDDLEQTRRMLAAPGRRRRSA